MRSATGLFSAATAEKRRRFCCPSRNRRTESLNTLDELMSAVNWSARIPAMKAHLEGMSAHVKGMNWSAYIPTTKAHWKGVAQGLGSCRQR